MLIPTVLQLLTPPRSDSSHLLLGSRCRTLPHTIRQCFQFEAFQFPLQSYKLLYSLHPHLPPPSPSALISKSHNNIPI
ncbi:hypothetical protein IC582_021523 [Cucumis melo]